MYIVVIEDRHVDVEVLIFNDKDKAIAKGRELAKEYCRHQEDYEEEDLPVWLFYARYSCEDDCVSVREVQVSD